jgi:hypothetical protein
MKIPTLCWKGNVWMPIYETTNAVSVASCVKSDSVLLLVTGAGAPYMKTRARGLWLINIKWTTLVLLEVCETIRALSPNVDACETANRNYPLWKQFFRCTILPNSVISLLSISLDAIVHYAEKIEILCFVANEFDRDGASSSVNNIGRNDSNWRR